MPKEQINKSAKELVAGKPIIITGKKHGLPYSKGLMASSIMAAGLSPGKAYRIAKQMEDHLRDQGIYSLTIGELKELTMETLRTKVGEESADNYLQWQALGKLEKPLIILIGGTTGVGKSTIAAELAHRLGIVRIVSTDAIREVMRSLFSKELMPALYNSSFNAWEFLRLPLPKSADPVVLGFREQAQTVLVGIEAIIERAINEGTNLVIEGAHVIPGFLYRKYSRKAFIIPLMIVVNDAEQHRGHFHLREVESESYRPFKRYLANFDNIRKIQDYVKNLAKDHDVPIFSSYNLDTTISRIMSHIMNEIFSKKRALKPVKAKA